MKQRITRIAQSILPASLYRSLLDWYHWSLAYLGAAIYGFPSRKLVVIAVTGTKGKSSVVELVRAILIEAGYATAVASTIRFCIQNTCERNIFKMTMPGRFFLQKFLRRAVDGGCTHAVIEMTSEGAKQFRHKGIKLDALVFTNLAPEHIESHGGFEKYAEAKLSLATHLETSKKRPRCIVANADDAYGKKFLAIEVEKKSAFALKEAEPFTADSSGSRFFWRGELVTTTLPGVFNLKNILAAFSLGESLGIPLPTMRRAIEKTHVISGRAERIERGQGFSVVVDYAHTPDSLQALYDAFKEKEVLAERKHKKEVELSKHAPRRICVLGSTGGGRDTWKRPEMGKIADACCDLTILTDEDPYDEDPKKILEEVGQGFSQHTPEIILDRRAAIGRAFEAARDGDVVLITGKGTDPYIMKANGQKEEWSDKQVAEEELDRLIKTRTSQQPA